MTRIQYNRELENLQDDILLMGSMVTEALSEAVAALLNHDLETARRLINYDRQVNERKYDIEERCLTLIATQQPTAGDLRLLAAILEVSTELERIGDYAKGIGKIILYIGHEPQIKPMVEITRMCEKASDMLRRSLDAFVNKDLDAAQMIPLEDDELDTMYNQVNRDLIAMMLANASIIDHANYILWVAHNLERAGDRVTNICERIIYTITGQLMEFDADEPEYSGIR